MDFILGIIILVLVSINEARKGDWSGISFIATVVIGFLLLYFVVMYPVAAFVIFAIIILLILYIGKK